jgi:hypothetical protein
MKAEEIVIGACAEEFGADISARADLSALFSAYHRGKAVINAALHPSAERRGIDGWPDSSKCAL